jgi:hypothetical protein
MTGCFMRLMIRVEKNSGLSFLRPFKEIEGVTDGHAWNLCGWLAKAYVTYDENGISTRRFSFSG